MNASNKRLVLLLAYAVLALPFVGYGAWRAMQTNANSPIDWVPASFPPRADYDRFRERFGSGDVIVVSWDGCTLRDTTADKLVQVLRNSPNFYDNGQWYFERVTTSREMLRQLIEPPAGLPFGEAVARLRGTLIGPDDTACVVITFTAAGLKQRARLVSLIRGALSKYCGVKADEWHMAGPVIDGLSVDEAGKNTLDRFAAPSSVIILIVCWWCLRSFRAALLVFGVSLFAQGLTLALIHFCGDTMSALLTVMPPLIQVLAVAGGIHLINYFFDAARSGDPDAADRAFRMGWLPCTLSAVTTAVGMASLGVSQLTPVRAFGMYAAAGVVMTAALLLTFIPGILRLWPIEPIDPIEPAEREDAAAHERSHQRGRIWHTLTAGLRRTHWLIVVAALAAMGFAARGISKLESSVRIETLFPSDSRILRDYRWLEKHIGPLVPIEVVLTCDDDCPLSTRQQMSLVWRCEQALQQIDGVGGTMSAAKLIPQLPDRNQTPPAIYDRAINEILKRSRRQFAESHYLDEANNTGVWRVTAYVSALDEIDYGAFLDIVRHRIEPVVEQSGTAATEHLTVTYTGIMPLVHEIQRQLMEDLFKSFAGAFVIIAVVMTVVQAGLTAGLVSMLPNIFPTLLLFGSLGLLRIPVDIGSVMTASIALGIAVDDTLHFLTFFRRFLDSGKSRPEAVLHALEHCGPAMVQTTITCGLGMLIFAAGDFVPTNRFAWMMAALLLTALIGDLILLPALLLGPFGRLFESPQASDRPTQFQHSGRAAA